MPKKSKVDDTLWYARNRVKAGAYVSAIRCAARVADWTKESTYGSENQTKAMLLILDYFDKAYSEDKKLASEAIQNVHWRMLGEDEYRARIDQINHIRGLVFKQLGGEMLGVFGEALVETASLLPRVLQIAKITKLFK
jgi:hypothetical protein